MLVIATCTSWGYCSNHVGLIILPSTAPLTTILPSLSLPLAAFTIAHTGADPCQLHLTKPSRLHHPGLTSVASTQVLLIVILIIFKLAFSPPPELQHLVWLAQANRPTSPTGRGPITQANRP